IGVLRSMTRRWAVILLMSGGCQQIGDLGRSQVGSATEVAGETQGGKSSDAADIDDVGATETAVVEATLERVGGDVTYRNLLQDLGAQFFDRSGEPRDVLEVLRDEGITL